MTQVMLLTLFFFSCEESTGSEKAQTVDMKFGYANQSQSRSKAVDKVPTAIIITIEDAGGAVVHQSLQLAVQDFNGTIVTQPLALNVGTYTITEYKVVNAADLVIYATPHDGSTAAALVSDALPINFTVTADGNTVISPEVIDTEQFVPADFGYTSSGFEIVPTFHFLVNVNYYDGTQGQYLLTNSDIEVKSGNHTDFNEAVVAITKTIEIRDFNDSTYTVTVTKDGFQDWSNTYTNAEMKAFADLPLTVVLVADPAFVINATSTASRVAVVNSLDYQNLNISLTDLANSDQGTFSSITGVASNITLVSGVQEGPYVDHGANVNSGEETIINLDLSTNTNGYDISSLYLAFGNKNSGDMRNYDVYFSSVASVDYTLVTSIANVGSATGSWSSANWGDDTITPTTESFIALNVDAIKIVWNAANSFLSYKVWEVDVSGSPSSN
jgi:hypothetical protein